MLQSRCLQLIKYFRLEFWLSVPLLGLAFWFFCGWVTQQALINFSNDDIKLEVSVKPQYSSSRQFFSISVVEINRQKGFSMVKAVKKIQGQKAIGMKKLELKLFTTDLQEIETEIAKELELSPEQVRRFLSN